MKKVYAQNKRLSFDYFILEEFETGIELYGYEVKQIRNGGIDISKAHIMITPRGECFLCGSVVRASHLTSGFVEKSYDPTRQRRLLLHKKQIDYINGKVKETGIALVPISVYPGSRFIKVRIAIAKGKKLFDKREQIKQRDLKILEKRQDLGG